MIGESFAIIAVILVLAAMIARSGRRLFSAFTLPLISIPALHLIGAALRVGPSLYLLDIAGLVVGLVLCFLCSRAFRSRKARMGYFAFCCFFLVALEIAYLMQVL